MHFPVKISNKSNIWNYLHEKGIKLINNIFSKIKQWCSFSLHFPYLASITPPQWHFTPNKLLIVP